MDILKAELIKKRRSLCEETAGRKVFRRIQKRRGEDQRDADPKRPCQNQNQNSSDPSNPNFILDSTKSKPESDSQKLDLPKQEVIRRHRLLRQPVALFGETDDDRLDRLHAGLLDLDDDSDMTEGPRNDFLVELKRKPKYEDVDVMDQDNHSKNLNLCDEDKIVVFFNKLLIEWNQELDQMTPTDKRTAKGKSTFATFKQCQTYLDPLFKLCRNKVLRDDIRQALMLAVNCCVKRDYKAAFDHYIGIAIGKSAWPIGVTMVGIHERSAREKIHTSGVAHVMNDETTRKYLTSVKRLITFCERRHPSTSKAVEFSNSLAANGSVY